MVQTARCYRGELSAIDSRFISIGIVRPWITTEKVTTPKVAMRISLLNGIDTGSARARASASAPRSPPHHRIC